MFHYRATHNRYKNYPKPTECPFCKNINQERIIDQTEHHLIVPNRVMYDVWELRRVTEHYMIIPRRHVRSLNELTEAEQLDHVQLMARYEVQGFNIYARSAGSFQRSVEHQHTHLIKTKQKQAHGSLILRTPYVMVTF